MFSLQTVLLLFFPFLIGLIILAVRLGFLWLEREQVALHARTIYVRSLYYVREKESQELNLELLAFRQAFYGYFFSEKRIYKILLKRLKDFTSSEDRELEKSYEFLEQTTL